MTSKSARCRVAKDTRACHQALHNDPLLAALTDGAVSETDYRRALVRFAAFHAGVEADRHRLGCGQVYTLTPFLHALAADGAAPPYHSRACGLRSQGELMGGLYVAYGSLLGRAMMKRPVTTALPLLPHRYMNMPFPTSAWRSLCTDLEAQALHLEGYQPMRTGALKAFKWMQHLLSG